MNDREGTSSIQQAHNFLNELDREFWRQYKPPEADNRAKAIMAVKYLLEDHAHLLQAARTARQMYATGHPAADCLQVVVTALENLGYV